MFAPEAGEMYPPGERTRVQVSGLTAALCGPHRPNHFDGVTTIVSKLFAVSGECVAVFGRKDYQQLKVIERMTRDLLLPVEVVGFPTLRDADGLALSSRNVHSRPKNERARALDPARAERSGQAFSAGERRICALLPAQLALAESGLRLDYATFADPDELVPLAEDALAAIACCSPWRGFMGKTRLIDNVVLGEDPAPIAS